MSSENSKTVHSSQGEEDEDRCTELSLESGIDSSGSRESVVTEFSGNVGSFNQSNFRIPPVYFGRPYYSEETYSNPSILNTMKHAIKSGNTTIFEEYLEEFIKDRSKVRHIQSLLKTALDMKEDAIVQVILNKASHLFGLHTYQLLGLQNQIHLFHLACQNKCFLVLRHLRRFRLPEETLFREIENIVSKINETNDEEYFEVISHVSEHIVKGDEQGVMMFGTLQHCKKHEKVADLFTNNQTKYGTETMKKVFIFCCENNLVDKICKIHLLMPPIEKTIMMKKGIKEASQRRHQRLVDTLFYMISNVKCASSSFKNGGTEVKCQTLLQQMQQINEFKFTRHQSPADKFPFDVILDKRLCYYPKCGIEISEKLLSDLGAGWPPKTNALSDMIPCADCIKSNNNYRKNIFMDILQVWILRNHVLDKTICDIAINANNILLLALLVTKRDNCITFIKYCIDTNGFWRMHVNRKSLIHTLAKIICSHIYNELSPYFDYIRVFLSIKGDNVYRKRRDILPFQHLVRTRSCIIAIFHGSKNIIFPDVLYEIPIEWKPLTQIKENERSNTEVKRKVTEVHISSVCADRLFQCHSNLNIVSSAAVKKRRNELIKTKCIVLYCWAKGFIPIGEDSFPGELNGIPTDVREGFCFYGAGTNLQMGNAIGAMNDGTILKSGTCGGFLEKNGMKLALTCAHVLLSEAELLESCICDNIKYPVVSSDTGERKGEIYSFVFKYGQQKETSIDAAVVRIDENVEINGKLPEENSSKLRKSGFLTCFPPSFQDGQILDVRTSKHIRNSVVKYGSETGLTRGSLCLDGTHVRMENIQLLLQEPITRMLNGENVEKRSDKSFISVSDGYNFIPGRTSVPPPNQYLMYNQFEIDSHVSFGPFFQMGDSGSLVFLQMENPSLSCVGMAIGSTSHGTCIVTPITDIIEQLDQIIDPEKKYEPLHFKKFNDLQVGAGHPLVSQVSVSSETSLSESSSTGSLDNALPFSPGISFDFATMFSNLSRQMQESFQSLDRRNQAIEFKIENLDKKIDSNAKSTDEKFQYLNNKIDAYSKAANENTEKPDHKKIHTPERTIASDRHIDSLQPQICNDSDSESL